MVKHLVAVIEVEVSGDFDPNTIYEWLENNVGTRPILLADSFEEESVQTAEDARLRFTNVYADHDDDAPIEPILTDQELKDLDTFGEISTEAEGQTQVCPLCGGKGRTKYPLDNDDLIAFGEEVTEQVEAAWESDSTEEHYARAEQRGIDAKEDGILEEIDNSWNERMADEAEKYELRRQES